MALRGLLWLLVPAVGLAELVGHFDFSSRPPRIDEWSAVAASVGALRKHGELVVIAPDWAEPNARHAFGDAVMPLADVARADESARATAIEVSILGASAPELARWKIRNEARVGKFRLRVLDNPAPAKPLYDFVDHVADATVVDLRGSGESPCPWNPNGRKSAGGLHGDPAFPSARHDCGGDGHFVGVTVIEDQGWRARRCLWAEPSAGATLSIRFHDVPLGRVIRGYAALPQWTERELRGAPVDLAVLVDGERAGQYVHKDGDGWKKFEIPLARSGAALPTGDVEFRISSSRGGRGREFCFQADTR